MCISYYLTFLNWEDSSFYISKELSYRKCWRTTTCTWIFSVKSGKPSKCSYSPPFKKLTKMKVRMGECRNPNDKENKREAISERGVSKRSWQFEAVKWGHWWAERLASQSIVGGESGWEGGHFNPWGLKMLQTWQYLEHNHWLGVGCRADEGLVECLHEHRRSGHQVSFLQSDDRRTHLCRHSNILYLPYVFSYWSLCLGCLIWLTPMNSSRSGWNNHFSMKTTLSWAVFFL